MPRPNENPVRGRPGDGAVPVSDGFGCRVQRREQVGGERRGVCDGRTRLVSGELLVLGGWCSGGPGRPAGEGGWAGRAGVAGRHRAGGAVLGLCVMNLQRAPARCGSGTQPARRSPNQQSTQPNWVILMTQIADLPPHGPTSSCLRPAGRARWRPGAGADPRSTRSEPRTVSRERAHSTGVESTTHTSSLHTQASRARTPISQSTVAQLA